MRIINIPIEPLEERYSTQWHEWFEREFKNSEVDFLTIKGMPLTERIERGSFLDVIGTNYYKATQIAQICDKIHKEEIGHDTDVFFFHDIWFPGIEMLAYIRDGLKKKFKICGCLHAGTYDQNDFTAKNGMDIWGGYFELSLMNFVDKVFVATDYHKNLFVNERHYFGSNPRSIDNRQFNYKKIVTTGFPIYAEDIQRRAGLDLPGYKGSRFNNQIVFPHRLDPEKAPEKFDELHLELKRLFPDWSWIKTMPIFTDVDYPIAKERYYETLAQSKVAISFAKQETWGIAMQEALFCGCIPLVPNRLSYREMYDKSLIYGSYSELILKLIRAIKTDDFMDAVESTYGGLKYKGEIAIPNMIAEMGMML